VDYAIEEKADLVLFCGDAYKSREPTQTQQREFAKRINRLSASGIPTFLLVGNHDLHNAFGRATSTEIFDTLAVKNIYVSNRPDVYRIPTPGGTVQVASLPWLRRSSLMRQEDAKKLSIEQLNRMAQDVLTNILTENAAKLAPALPAILAAHVWVAGARTGTEKGMTMGQEHALLPGTVAQPGFDYVALGHIHRHQVIQENPPVVYAGSMERLDFGDEDDEKGFYVVEINEGDGGRHTSFRFQPLPGRRFLTINASLEEDDINPTATVLRAIAEQGDCPTDAIVRLNIKLPGALAGQLRDGEIRAALSGAHYFTIAREVQHETRLRLGTQAVEELTPLDALKKCLDAWDTPPERAKVLLEYGQKLIEGETSPENN
jgi:exonuclease SbcD